MNSKPIIGILGAGKLGTTLGRLFIEAGYKVLISSSKPVENIALTIEVLVPGAIPLTNLEVTQQADIILLALPLGKYKTIPTDYLKEKIVIDAMNYWWEVDGLDRIPSDPALSSSEMIQDFLPESYVVKAFNHMGYHDLEIEQNNQKVIAFSTDYPKTKETISKLILDSGFIPLDLGVLKNGIVLEPGYDLFGANLTLDEFISVLDKQR